MKHILFILLNLLFLVGFSGCEDTGPDFLTEEMPLVVEGWIEEGEAPVVMVTRALNLNDTSLTLEDAVQKWCRVSIFDGYKQHFLSGKINKAYTPPFIFTTSGLKGEVGHTYRLLIETETETAESFGTLSPAPTIEKIIPEKVAGNDSLYQLRIFLKAIDLCGYYKLFAKSQREDSRFYGSFLGTFSGSQYTQEEGWVVTRGLHSTYDNQKDFSHFFKTGDIVKIKICAIEKPVFDFWKVYESNISLSNNLFFSFSENCPSTLSGALGYWGTYGTATSAIRIP
ncbi:MAG: DUF4249 domain-containing protein [Muribaculaceae bacterium]|nr:DUF4249 domain-containing protein [Muribaculaceae bacterium]